MSESVRMPRDAFFLPNFCDIRMVFAVVVIGELLAFVLTLAPFAPGGERWSQLSVISLFVQWVGSQFQFRYESERTAKRVEVKRHVWIDGGWIERVLFWPRSVAKRPGCQ